MKGIGLRSRHNTKIQNFTCTGTLGSRGFSLSESWDRNHGRQGIGDEARPAISAPALRERETSGTHGNVEGALCQSLLPSNIPTTPNALNNRCMSLYVAPMKVTNNLGIEWLRSYLGDEYRIHVLTFKMAEPRPLTEALSIIGPGLVLFNPDRPCNEEEMFLKAGWRVVTKPRQLESGSQPLWMMSTDVSTNILMLDTKRAIVCRHEPTSNKASS